MALTAGGVLLSWGSGQQGQLGRVGTRLPERTLRETLLRPHPVPLTRRIRGMGVPRVVDFSCGTYSSFALAAGGHCFAWGLNNYGQLALPGQVGARLRVQHWCDLTRGKHSSRYWRSSGQRCCSSTQVPAQACVDCNPSRALGAVRKAGCFIVTCRLQT